MKIFGFCIFEKESEKDYPLIHCTCGCGWKQMAYLNRPQDEMMRAAEQAWRCKHPNKRMTSAGYEYCYDCHHWLSDEDKERHI